MNEDTNTWRRIVRAECVPIEYYAAAHLCEVWSDRAKSMQSIGAGQRRRVDLLRQAVIAGAGQRWKIPHELIKADWENTAAMVIAIQPQLQSKTWRSSRLRSMTVPIPGVPKGQRPVPWSTETCQYVVDLFADRRSTEKSIARLITEDRLCISRSTVDAARRKAQSSSRLRLSPVQRSGISLYIDHCIVMGAQTTAGVARGRLLDALASSGLKPIALYYLAQLASQLPRNRSARACELALVTTVCKKLGWRKAGTFERLVPD